MRYLSPKGGFTGGYLVDSTPPDLSSNLPEEPPIPQKNSPPEMSLSTNKRYFFQNFSPVAGFYAILITKMSFLLIKCAIFQFFPAAGYGYELNWL